jgi:hypothetical protein
VLKRNLSFVFNGLASAKGEQLFGFVPDSFGSNVGQGSDKGRTWGRDRTNVGQKKRGGLLRPDPDPDPDPDQ